MLNRKLLSFETYRQQNDIMKRMQKFEINLPFDSEYDLLAVQFSVSYLIALSLNFLIFVIGLITT